MSIESIVTLKNDFYEQHKLVTNEGNVYIIKDLSRNNEMINWDSSAIMSTSTFNRLSESEYKMTPEDFLRQYSDAIKEIDSNGTSIIESFLNGELKQNWKDNIQKRYTSGTICICGIDTKILHDTLSGEIEYSITNGITWHTAHDIKQEG